MRAALLALVAALALASSAQAAFPGANGRIAFDRTTPYSTSRTIFTIDPTGGGLQQLTTSGPDLYPAWSPNGLRIAYTESGRVCTVSSAGLDERCFDAPPGRFAVFSSWSADGARLLFATTSAGPTGGVGTDLWVARPDGSGARQLVDGTLNPAAAAWSPDGRTIAFMGGGDLTQPTDLFAVDADGSDPRNLTSTPAVAESFPDWSPDGSAIAYARDAAEVWTVAPDGSAPRRIGTGSEPAFSPDGTAVIATRVSELRPDRTHTEQLFTMPAAGGDGTAITDAENFSGAADWQPVVDIAGAAAAKLAARVSAASRKKLAKGLGLRFPALLDGKLGVALLFGANVLGRGTAAATPAGVTVRLRLTRKGRERARRGTALRGRVQVSYTPVAGPLSVAVVKVRH